MKNSILWIIIAILTILLVLQYGESNHTYRQACYMSDLIRMHMDNDCGMSYDVQNYGNIVEEEINLKDYSWCY